jgi:hypothetical protein
MLPAFAYKAASRMRGSLPLLVPGRAGHQNDGTKGGNIPAVGLGFHAIY